MGVREFVRRQLMTNDALTDDELGIAYKAAYPANDLKAGAIARARTECEKLIKYNQQAGLASFFSSQAQLLLAQYKNIEDLLGPPGADWGWPGEHCEVLLRDFIARHLPPSLAICKGYVHGMVKGVSEIKRSPEIDILIYNHERFPPLFVMGEFAIVRAEAVVATIQVKRTLSAGSLDSAVKNVVDSKRHIADLLSEKGDFTAASRVFSAVVTFEDDLHNVESDLVSESYSTVLKKHIAELEDGDFLPDFVGSLTGTFLVFPAVNMNRMLYQAFDSIQTQKNVALPFLLYWLINKIRGRASALGEAIPEQMRLKQAIKVWERVSP